MRWSGPQVWSMLAGHSSCVRQSGFPEKSGHVGRGTYKEWSRSMGYGTRVGSLRWPHGGAHGWDRVHTGPWHPGHLCSTAQVCGIQSAQIQRPWLQWLLSCSGLFRHWQWHSCSGHGQWAPRAMGVCFALVLWEARLSRITQATAAGIGPVVFCFAQGPWQR